MNKPNPTLEEVYPEFGNRFWIKDKKKKGEMHPLDSQDLYCFNLYNTPLACPVCGESHTGNFVHLYNECNGVPIELQLGFFDGSQWITIKE